MPDRPPLAPMLPPADGLDDSAWLDVIQKMDEVYSQLVADEVALGQRAELA